MRNFIRFFLVIIILSLSASDFNNICAQEVLKVQTLKFDDITNRRGKWQFPNNDDTYRKILMYQTLKCDRQTARDIFDCGEWDYGSYTKVYKPTGEMDSTLKNVAKYNWGRGFPDTLFYTNEPTYNTYLQTHQSIEYDNIISETEYVIGEGAEDIVLENKPTKMQILFSKNLIKDIELSNKSISRMKLNVKTPGITVKNFSVKVKSSSKKNMEEFDTGEFTTLFEGDISFENEGWNYINFLESFRIISFSGFILQISYEAIENSETFILAADSFTDIIKSEKDDYFLEFDGRYDNVRCGNIDELKGKQKFTIEMWLRINKWRNNGFIFKMDDMIQFKVTEEYRQPRRYYWRLQDSAGYGIMVAGNVDFSGNWEHFALVYDGSQEQYNGRIKFYVNGSMVSGSIRGRFPDVLPDKDKMLKLISESANINCDIDEFRIWTDALDRETINDWKNKMIDDSHPNFEDIAVYYSMDNIIDFELQDESGNGHNGTLIGVPIQRKFDVTEHIKNQAPGLMRPQITFIEGEYESNINEVIDTIKVENSAISICTYELIDRTVLLKDVQYVREPGKFFTYDVDGSKIDSITINRSDFIKQDSMKYYTAPYEKTDIFEIGRYITPYGLGLDLGPDGVTWVYDVTDYAQLLKGEVDLSSGNTQELIDLRFEFIKGIPPRDVLSVDRIWAAMKSYSYRNLDDDTSLPKTTLPLLSEAKQFKVKTRITGHGHNSNDGSSPHCCEWRDNTHYLFANNQEVADWHVWRYYECGSNPVFPQGGTWPGRREGWCPGDIVKDYDFEITEYIISDSVSIDYAITPVPAYNLGMGNGNYLMAMHLVQYSDLNHEVDVEVYDVVAPNDWFLYSRMNPVCTAPTIVIRNNGRETLTSLKFTYGVSGGNQEIFEWNGSISSMIMDTIELPVSGNLFWVGDDDNNFTVTISEPNGQADEYSDNDSYTTHFNMPDLYENKIVLQLMTNLRAYDFTYKIKDIHGEIVFTKTNLVNSTLYRDTLDLPRGCYTIELLDAGHYGLSYWAFPTQGQGYFRIMSLDGQLLKSFNPDFGVGIVYSFDLDNFTYVQESGYEYMIQTFPNPAEDILNISLSYFSGDANLVIFSELGKVVSSEKVYIDDNYSKLLNVSEFASGVYFVRIYNDRFDFVSKFIKK